MGRLLKTVAIILVLLLAGVAVAAKFLLFTQPAYASSTAFLSVFSGSATVSGASGPGRTVTLNATLVEGDTVTTAAGARAAINFPDGSLVRMDGGTTLALTATHMADSSAPRHVTLSEQIGRLWVDVTHQGGGSFTVNTPTATAEVRGTQFEVDYVTNATSGRLETWVRVLTDTVTVSAQGQSVQVTPGQKTRVAQGQPPAPVEPQTEKDQSAAFRLFNQAANATAGDQRILAFEAGMLDAPHAMTYANTVTRLLTFTLVFARGSAGLDVSGPSGAAGIASGDSPRQVPLNAAAAGGYTATPNAIAVPAGTRYVLLVSGSDSDYRVTDAEATARIQAAVAQRNLPVQLNSIHFLPGNQAALTATISGLPVSATVGVTVIDGRPRAIGLPPAVSAVWNGDLSALASLPLFTRVQTGDGFMKVSYQANQ